MSSSKLPFYISLIAKLNINLQFHNKFENNIIYKLDINVSSCVHQNPFTSMGGAVQIDFS